MKDENFTELQQVYIKYDADDGAAAAADDDDAIVLVIGEWVNGVVCWLAHRSSGGCRGILTNPVHDGGDVAWLRPTQVQDRDGVNPGF